MAWIRYLESVAEIWHRMGTGKPAPREAEYKGYTFRSHLEVRFAWYLDQIGETWRYEPAIYGPKGEGYKPDFEIIGAVRPTFIELKPTLEEVEDAKRKMSVIWDYLPEALLIVASEEGRMFFAAYLDHPWVEWQQLWAMI